MPIRPPALVLALITAIAAAAGCASNRDECDRVSFGASCDGNGLRTCEMHTCDDAILDDCRPHTIISTQSCGPQSCVSEGPGRAACVPAGTSFACAAGLPLASGTGPARAGDLDGDGKADLVVLDRSRAHVFLQRSGALSEAASVAVADAANLFVADVDADGHVDLVFAAEPLHQWAKGAGDGTFGPAIDLLPASVGLLTVGDANGDGRADFFLGDASVLRVLINHSDGSFTPHEIDVGHNGGSTLALGDLDHDGRTDLVLADPYSFTTSTATVYLAEPDGSYRPGAVVSTGPQPSPIVADVDGDGQLDLAIASYGDPRVTIALGSGDGTFRAPFVIHAGTAAADGLHAADVNGDGRLDFVVDLEDHALGVLVADVRGGFDASFFDPTREEVIVLDVADVDGDGKADAIVTGLGGVRVVPGSCL